MFSVTVTGKGGQSFDRETERFKRTFERYAQLRRKTHQEIVTDKALDLAYTSLQETKRAQREKIDILGTESDPKRKDWWRYISWLIYRQGFVISKGRKVKGKYTKTYKVYEGKSTFEQQQEVSEKIKSNRRRAIGYIASGWIPAIKYFYPLSRGKTRGSNSVAGVKQFGKPQGSGTLVDPRTNPTAILVNRTEAAVKVGLDGARRALIKIRADMSAYIQKKVQRLGAEVFRA